MKWLSFVTFVLVLGMAFAAVSCSCDDDDDDDNDDADDDDDVSDDDDDGGDCEGYDLIIEGQTQSTPVSTWAVWLNINVETGQTSGLLVSDNAEIGAYDVTGFRHDATSGELQGSFPTPSTIPADVCEAETVSNHIDFTVLDGVLDGVVTIYCGAIAEENLLSTADVSGEVTCGDFAM